MTINNKGKKSYGNTVDIIGEEVYETKKYVILKSTEQFQEKKHFHNIYLKKHESELSLAV